MINGRQLDLCVLPLKVLQARSLPPQTVNTSCGLNEEATYRIYHQTQQTMPRSTYPKTRSFGALLAVILRTLDLLLWSIYTESFVSTWSLAQSFVSLHYWLLTTLDV
jgi:hypothetical protein